MSAISSGIIVAIGYQINPVSTGMLYDKLRDYDLTPPKSEHPPDDSGGADFFLDFIEQQVKPLVRKEFPDINIGREALFGHSYGGLFALHVLFKRTKSFNTYIAASPSIWWSDKFLLGEEQEFYKQPVTDSKPTLLLSFGELENEPKITSEESGEKFQDRLKRYEHFGVGGDTDAMHKRLRESGMLEYVSLTEFEGEDHLSVVGCSLNRSMKVFLDAF